MSRSGDGKHGGGGGGGATSERPSTGPGENPVSWRPARRAARGGHPPPRYAALDVLAGRTTASVHHNPVAMWRANQGQVVAVVTRSGTSRQKSPNERRRGQPGERLGIRVARQFPQEHDTRITSRSENHPGRRSQQSPHRDARMVVVRSTITVEVHAGGSTPQVRQHLPHAGPTVGDECSPRGWAGR